MKIGWMIMGTGDRGLDDNIKLLNKILDTYPEDTALIVSNGVSVTTNKKERMFYIETNANSGVDLGAGDAISFAGILIDKHPILRSMDYWVFANFDCVLHGIEATRELCETMKDGKKIFASYFRQINVDLNEPIAPHSDWFVFDNNWNIKEEFFKTFQLADQGTWLPERTGKHEGTELALLRLLVKNLYKYNINDFPHNGWQLTRDRYPIVNYTKILNLGLTDYRKNCPYFFHTHDMEEYEKFAKEVGLRET